MSDDFRIPGLGPCSFESPLESACFLDEDSGVLVDATIAGYRACDARPAFLEQAGPRRKLFFEPALARAAVVTCGGLCPGLNDVIRAVTMVLRYRYGVRNILGLRVSLQVLCRAA